MRIYHWQSAQCLANDYQRSAQILDHRIQFLQQSVSPYHLRVALLQKERRELLKAARKLDSVYRLE